MFWCDVLLGDDGLWSVLSDPVTRVEGDVVQTAVETAAEKLEDGGSADVVLRDLADAVSAEISDSNGTSSADESSQQAVRVDGLAEVRESLLVDHEADEWSVEVGVEVALVCWCGCWYDV